MQRCVSPCLDLGPCARFPAVLKQGLSTGVHGRKGNHRTLLSPIIEGASRCWPTQREAVFTLLRRI